MRRPGLPSTAAPLLWVVAAGLLFGSGCTMLEPSNRRNWSPDQAVLARAVFDGERVHVHNIRNCKYAAGDTYVVDHYDRSFELEQIRTVDFFVVPFLDNPLIAHTMISFGFIDEHGEMDHVAVSVEIRKERGEEYAAWKGSLRQYELMYVVADERDVIGVRTHHRGEQVYLYRSIATPEQARALFVDVMGRVNKLAEEPEFYDTLTNNCTTNIVRHINRLNANRVAFDYRLLFPGHSDRLAYDLDLIERHGSFEDTKSRAHINDLASRYRDSPNFSQDIRQRL